MPKLAARQLARQGITLDITLLDLKRSHLLPGNRSIVRSIVARSIGVRSNVADALALPFPDGSFDLVSRSLFAHHLEPAELARFVQEALRVSRVAVLINDLIRHPLHLALVYAGWPLMRSHVSRVDGVASVRRAYTPEEMRSIVESAIVDRSSPRVKIHRRYLFRMGAVMLQELTFSSPPIPSKGS